MQDCRQVRTVCKIILRYYTTKQQRTIFCKQPHRICILARVRLKSYSYLGLPVIALFAIVPRTSRDYATPSGRVATDYH